MEYDGDDGEMVLKWFYYIHNNRFGSDRAGIILTVEES